MPERALISVRNVTRRFSSRPGVIPAVDDVTLDLARGQTVGVVGESGSGKSTLGRLITGLDTPTRGHVLVDGVDLGMARGPARRAALRHVQMVFQDPYSSLNPRMTVGRQVGEALLVQGGLSSNAIDAVVADLFEKVGLRRSQMTAYPHEFSGGQRQRIAIARALAPDPDLVIADEPVSALDVSVQAQILNLMVELQRSRGLGYLFITHDIAVVAHISHLIVVMYRGRVVERGLAHEIVGDAHHPYTRALLDAVPRFGRRRGRGSVLAEPWTRAPSRHGEEWHAASATHGYLRDG